MAAQLPWYLHSRDGVTIGIDMRTHGELSSADSFARLSSKERKKMLSICRASLLAPKLFGGHRDLVALAAPRLLPTDWLGNVFAQTVADHTPATSVWTCRKAGYDIG